MEELIRILQARRIGILYILKMIPLELFEWAPTDMRSTSKLANHIACAPLCLYEGLKGNIPDENTYKNLEKNNMPLNAQGLIKLYEEGLSKLINYLEDHLEDALDENIQLFYQDHRTSMYKEVFGEIGHLWFHLGQLFTYLKQNGVPIDMGAYYGYKDPDPSIQPNE
ncbi:MAG: DinB family protein [Candidatus Hodarchaeales archaeon]|jgi:hypothetical protein